MFTETPQRFWDLARQRLGDSAGTKALIEVLLLHRSLPADAVTRGLGAALGVGSADPAVVAIEARNHRSGQAVVIAIGERLHRFDRPKPTLDHYDTLLEAQP